MVVFRNKLKKSKRRDEQDEPLKMVDREVDREMGLELLECFFGDTSLQMPKVLRESIHTKI